MANEIIKVNLIPGVDDPTPILHFSQYDNGRTFIAEIYNGDDPFDCDDYNVTLECRKRDNNLVILTSASIDNNQITFHSTEQLCACYGDNDSEIVIRDNNDLVIGSGNIIINVEKSPTCGGINSESELNNLSAQVTEIINDIAPEVVEDVATPIVRNIAIQQIERYGGTWLMAVAQVGEQRVIFSNDIIGDDLITAYKVYSEDDSVIIDHYDVSPGSLTAYFDEAIQTNTRFLLQYFRPF